MSIDSWRTELRDLQNRLDRGLVPSSRVPALELRATVKQHQRAMEVLRDRSERMARLNAVHKRLGELIAEQPKLCRTAGISKATLDDPIPGSRWTSAVSELAGGPAVIDADLGVFMQRSVTAIGKLVATEPAPGAGMRKKKKSGPVAKAEQRAWIATAMMLVRDHPDWSDAEIARAVGKAGGMLSRCVDYQNAAQIARAGSVRRGRRVVERGSERHTLEVEDDRDE